MSRSLLARVAPWSALSVCALLASSTPAHAQLVKRDRGASSEEGDKKDDGKKTDKKPAADDDDDILAPAKDDKGKKPDDKKPDEQKPDDGKKAKAKTLGLVGLVPVGDAQKPTADSLTAALLKELNESSVYEVVALAVETGSKGAVVDESAAKKAKDEADAQLDKAKGLLEKLAFGKAKKAFEAALASYEQAAPVLADSSPMFEARVGLAEVAARQGQEDEANIQLAWASALNPEQELDAKKYPPLFIRTHQKKRQALMKEPRGTVLVDATGAGSAVELDGRATGIAPIKLKEVPPGKHLVRVLREGLPAYGIVVEIRPEQGKADATVTPGFLSADGTSYVDDLGQNRLSHDAAKAIGAAVKDKSLDGALVGVVGKKGGLVPCGLVFVDRNGSMAQLPAVQFQGDLLDVSIEVLPAREKAEKLVEGADAAQLTASPIAVVLEGQKAGAARSVAELTMKYDVKQVKEKERSRVLDDKKKPDDDSGVIASGGGGGDDDDGRVVGGGGGGSGKSARLDDKEDVFKGKGGGEELPDPDAPVTEQAWFWPTVVGGAVGGALVLASGTVLGLVAAKVLPDPRPAGGVDVHVTPP